MKCTKSVVVFVVDGMSDHTRKNTEIIIFRGRGINRITKFRNTHWPKKSLTSVEDKPWKLFCKTSLNARE